MSLPSRPSVKMETSISEEIDSSSGVRFLGAELHRDGLKWRVTQQNYIQDLLVRNLGGDTTSGQKKDSSSCRS